MERSRCRQSAGPKRAQLRHSDPRLVHLSVLFSIEEGFLLRRESFSVKHRWRREGSCVNEAEPITFPASIRIMAIEKAAQLNYCQRYVGRSSK